MFCCCFFTVKLVSAYRLPHLERGSGGGGGGHGGGRGGGREGGRGYRREFVFCLASGIWFPPPPPPTLLADGAVLLSGLGAGGAGDGLDGRRQGAEEARDEGEAQAAPRAEHGPAVAVADVVRQAVEIARVAGQLEVDARHAGAQGDDAEGPCGEKGDQRRVTWLIQDSYILF